MTRTGRGRMALGVGVTSCLVLASCHPKTVPDPCPQAPWDTVPLLPVIHFDQVGPPGVIQALFLDAQTGEPLPGGQLRMLDKPQSGHANKDGIALLRGVSEGNHRVVAASLGFAARYDTVAVTATEGRTRIYQLRKVNICLEERILTVPDSL